MMPPSTTRVHVMVAVLLLAAAGLVSGCSPRRPTSGETPDPSLTPGRVASTDAADVCGIVGGLSYSKRHRETPVSMKLEVIRRYKQKPNAGDSEIDHRVPLSLGGADTLDNLWYQMGHDRGVRFTYHEKDELEVWAWVQVCRRGSMSLTAAQALFLAPDWREVYCAKIRGRMC